MLLDQRHPGFYRGGDVGRHEAGGAGADYYQVALEAARPRPARVHLARPDRIYDLAGDEREDAEQREGSEQPRRKDAGERFDLRQLRAGVHIHQGAGQHADLAHPVESPGADRRQRQRQVDKEEGERRHQAQGEQIEGAVARDAGVDRLEPIAEARLHPVAQQEARQQEGGQRAQAGGKADDERAPGETEDRADSQRHHRRAGQRQRGDGDVGGEEGQRRRERMGRAPGLDGRLLRLEPVEAEDAAKVQGEIQADGQDDYRHHQQFAQLEVPRGCQARQSASRMSAIAISALMKKPSSSTMPAGLTSTCQGVPPER